MSKDSGLVKRLIAFLKKPDALAYEDNQPVHNPYDDYESPADPVREERYHEPQYEPEPLMAGQNQAPWESSRLDALIVRAVQQFSAQMGYVIRHAQDGQLHYCTGRTQQGAYIAHDQVDVDRRALFLALDSGESQLFIQSDDITTPGAVLCGPLWDGDQVIGVLYLDGPARSRLHRGVFDVFCDQAARMLAEGVG